MLNFRQFIRPLIPVAAVLLLCLTAMPAAEANNGSSSQKAATVEQQDANKQTKQPAATPKPRQKSILDADVLDRPLSFFSNPYTSDEDDDSDDMFSHTTTVVVAVKALIASLLSTII